MKRAEPFYTSPAWRKLRWSVLKRDHFRCAVCGCSVAAKGAPRVDHILPRRTHPELELDPANCRTLCALHDNQRHSEKGRVAGSRVAVGADGWPISNAHAAAAVAAYLKPIRSD